MHTNQYFLNTPYLSSNHQKTHISYGGDLLTINQPIYHIPVHVGVAIVLGMWRDDSSSSLPLTARRITYSIALGLLAIIGIVDVVIRIALAAFTFVIQRSTSNSGKFLSGASMGLQKSLYFATILHIHNFCEESIIPCIL